MPTIDPALIPTVPPGSVFSRLTSDTTLAIRWLEAADPLYYAALNRPGSDITVRQLIIAKSLDQLGLRISHQNLFPFLVAPTVDVATSKVSLPVSWIWDIHTSLKSKYTHLRLLQLQRISGTNDTSAGTYTGKIRLIFGGVINDSGSIITGLFYVDYVIDSSLEFQFTLIHECTSTIFSPALPSDETGSIAGYTIFKTLVIDDNSDFFDYIAPPVGATSSTSTGDFDVPATYNVSDTEAGGSGVTGDYSLQAVQYGTGMLVVSAYNMIPVANVDSDSILDALNFPFRLGANLSSTDGLSTIPTGMFSQFKMSVPTGDRDGSALEENYPIYITKIKKLDASANQLQLIFSTTSTIVGDTSDTLIEFASLTLNKSDFSTSGVGKVLEIVPFNNLRNLADPSQELFHQNFGSGTVVLSSNWGVDTTIETFFDSFETIVDDPAERYFATILNEFALDRAPSTVPTIGESEALAGTSARRTNPVHPSNVNRFVNEADSGLGDRVDFRTVTGFTSNDDIDPIAYSVSRVSRMVVLKVNSQNSTNFTYDTDILPRLRVLLSGDPQMFDVWFDGTTFKTYDSLSGTWIG